MRSATLIHLSDVHLGAKSAPGAEFWASLKAAVAHVARNAPGRVGVVVTGDLIDSPTAPTDVIQASVKRFVTLLAEALRQAPDVVAPIVLLPGNHDRRGDGLLAPWTHEAMELIANETAGLATVVAADALEPLAVRVPVLEELLEMNVVAYDSTHTVPGYVSAGGLIRTEDLLGVPGLHRSERPTMVLMHHHLVPTPVTDVGVTDTSSQGLIKQLLVGQALPRLITFGNREELFMTALGAGSGLSLLAALQTPALVLHGHKHYPTARLLTATTPHDGDVLLASAGSAGVLEGFNVTGSNDDPTSRPARNLHLWPSFNVVVWDGAQLDVTTRFFSPQNQNRDAQNLGLEPARYETRSQPLAYVHLDGVRWHPREEATWVGPFLKAVELDQARFTLQAAPGGFWNFECSRLVVGGDDELLSEPVEAAPGAVTQGLTTLGRRHAYDFRRGLESAYAVERGVCRTRATMQRLYARDEASPFEWVGLRVRRGAGTARLVVSGLGNGLAQCFASLTDLHTGDIRPLVVRRDGGVAEVLVTDCPARRLVRLHWPLDP